jgi:hypothetical protein
VLPRIAGIAIVLAWAGVASGIEDRADKDPSDPGEDDAIAWKLTGTRLEETKQRPALDVNLRGNHGPHTFWAGHYRRGEEFQQARLGYERQLEIPVGRIIASAQYATRGFFGGAATAEIGTGSAFGLAGWGRTNLKPYYNLNFDPNDSILYGGGWRKSKDTVVTLYQMRDDRLRTGQRITHFVLRTKPEQRTRWTADLFHKSGGSSSEDDAHPIRGTGFAIAYDYERYFARIARDPKVNFTDSDMWRFAAGMRF